MKNPTKKKQTPEQLQARLEAASKRLSESPVNRDEKLSSAFYHLTGALQSIVNPGYSFKADAKDQVVSAYERAVAYAIGGEKKPTAEAA